MTSSSGPCIYAHILIHHTHTHTCTDALETVMYKGANLNIAKHPPPLSIRTGNDQDEWIDGWMMDEWMDKWMDGWMDVRKTDD